MEGMKVELFCKFESDLAVLVNWVRPSQKSLAENMTTFEPKDPKSFQVVQEPSSGHPVMGETLIIEETKLADSGLYFCVGQTNSGMTPGFLHLKVNRLFSSFGNLCFVFSFITTFN
jgi:hypothetical protein